MEVEDIDKNNVERFCWLRTNQSHNLSLSNGNYKLKQGIYGITNFEAINKKVNLK